MARKSVVLTYLLWLIGGVFGLHHLYLGRDLQALLWCCTLGGYAGCGWLRDLFFIPEYVADANEDEKFTSKYAEKIRKHSTPPFSLTRYTGMILVAYVFTSVLMLAIPEEEVAGIDLKWLVVFVPVACALGVWAVGNIGQQKGTIWWALFAAFAVYPFRTYFDDDSTWLTTMTFLSASAFDNKSKQWRRKRERRSLCRRLTVFTLCLSLYMSLWCSYIYFNAKLTDSNGEEIRVHEALHHLFTSPLWTDLKQSLQDAYNFAQHHGWYETWKLVVDLSDPHGEQNAYKVLGVSSSATQAEITSSWRALSRKYHPDKVKDPDKRREAQEKFMEIQQAYEIVSSIRAKRSSRNKRYNP